MKNTIVRLMRILVKNSIKIITLLLAVSIVSFTLVSISPIDQVQQYLLGLGTAVSPEKRAELEQYWGVDKPPVERYMIWLNELLHGSYWPCYLIALTLSVLWNFTLNRKFTFQSANNVPQAMALVLLYYCAFTPLSTLLGSYLADTLHWNEYLVTFLNMVLNLVTEYVYDRLVVYRGAVDTARRPEKQPAEDCQ